MDDISAVLLFILSIIILLLALAFFGHLYQRIRIPNRFVWLELLDRQQWKTTLQLRKEMRQRVGTEGPAVLYTDLEALEEEGLIESQAHEGDVESSLYEYRLTVSGLKRKLRNHRPQSNPTLPRTV